MIKWSEREMERLVMLRKISFRCFRALSRQKSDCTERGSTVKLACVTIVAKKKCVSKDEMPFACLLANETIPSRQRVDSLSHALLIRYK